jgi:hypothetical protein
MEKFATGKGKTVSFSPSSSWLLPAEAVFNLGVSVLAAKATPLIILELGGEVVQRKYAAAGSRTPRSAGTRDTEEEDGKGSRNEREKAFMSMCWPIRGQRNVEGRTEKVAAAALMS